MLEKGKYVNFYVVGTTMKLTDLVFLIQTQGSCKRGNHEGS